MRLPHNNHSARAQSGILLLECMVYVALFAVITGLAFTAFYYCWDGSRGLLYSSNDIAAALQAGERWRADIRSATGNITVQTNATGELIRIPSGKNIILYRFNNGKIQRQLDSKSYSDTLLPSVKSSQMVMDARGPVSAWRWELELKLRPKEIHLPLQFTFEAAPGPTP